MSLSEEIKAVHGEIMAFLPPESLVIVEHTYRNYPDTNDEMWGCQVYETNDQPYDSMFMVHRATSVAELVEKSKIAYGDYRPDTVAKIAALEKQLAKLRGEEVNNEQ